MATGPGIDFDSLHFYLWEQTTAGGRLRLQQSELAEWLSVTRQYATQLIQRLIADGRMARTTEGGVYEVADPRGFPMCHDGQMEHS